MPVKALDIISLQPTAFDVRLQAEVALDHAHFTSGVVALLQVCPVQHVLLLASRFASADAGWSSGRLFGCSLVEVSGHAVPVASQM